MKCPKCGNEMIEKFWGGNDIRVVCENCGYLEIRRVYGINGGDVQHSEG